MFIRGLLLAMCATILSGCIVTPPRLQYTPARIDVLVPGVYYQGGYYGGYQDHHRRHHRDHDD